MCDHKAIAKKYEREGVELWARDCGYAEVRYEGNVSRLADRREIELLRAKLIDTENELMSLRELLNDEPHAVKELRREINRTVLGDD